MANSPNRSVPVGADPASSVNVLSSGAPTGSVGGVSVGLTGGAGTPSDPANRRAPPYPVAALLRRTRNAKSSRDLHDIAFNGWEASMRLAVAVKPPSDVSPLFEPSTGSWAAAVQAALSEVKLDDPDLRAVYSLFSRVGAGKNASPMFVTPKNLFQFIASYRNQLHGHGAVRGADFYDTAGEILLNGLEAAWRHWIFLPENGELVFVQSVEMDAAGQRRARIYLLKCGEPLLNSRMGSTEIPENLRPRRIYMRVEKRFYSLHPWLLYDDKDERERVLYYNGRNKYLDFISGETPRVDKLQDIYPSLFKELDALFRGKSATVFEDGREKNPNDFGDYELICELGHGGMATVCLAKQKSLERRVALKMPLPGLSADPIAIQRFAREVQVLSQCDHPNVVKILDSGVHNGTPYYVMEYIEGADLARISAALSVSGNIDDAISSASLQVRSERAERLNLPAAEPARNARSGSRFRSIQTLASDKMNRIAALFRDAARGLHHLHGHGIIHRDIKPGNLMLTEGEHRIVVMDLGLATLASQQTSLARDTTALLGTLRYMAPEQLQRQPVSLDRRADVYSLCATFYELLGGKPFYNGRTEQEMLQQILYEEPVPLGQINPMVPRDLQIIVAKGIQKDPRQRYQTADELAQDLKRFLRGEPIGARDPSLGYLLGLAIKRHKALVLTGAAATLLVGSVLVLAIFLWQSVLLEKKRAAEEAAAMAKTAEHNADMAHAQGLLLAGNAMENDGLFGQAKRSYDNARDQLLKLPASTDDAENHLNLLYLRHRPPVFFFEGHRTVGALKGRISSVACSPADDFTALTAGDEDGEGVVKLWDLRSGQEKASHRTGPGDRILCARFSPDGKSVLFCGWLSQLNIWEPDNKTDKNVRNYSGMQEPNACIAFSRDGTYAATGSYYNKVRLWDTKTEEQVGELELKAGGLPAGVVRAIAFDDKTIYAAGSNGCIFFCTFSKKTKVDPAAKPVADGPIALTMDLAVDKVIEAHKGGVNSIEITDNGKRLISGGDDRLMKVWSLPDGKELALAYGHQSDVVGVSAFTRTGGAADLTRQRVGVSASGTTLRVWDLDKIGEPQTLECGWHESSISGMAVQKGGKFVLTGGVDGSLMMWNLPALKNFDPFDVYASNVRSVRLSADGKLALACGNPENGELNVKLLDVDSGMQLREFAGLKARVQTAVFSPDERNVLGIDADGVVMQWPIFNSQSGKNAAKSNAPTILVPSDRRSPLSNVVSAFSPDGRLAAVSTNDSDLEIFDVQSRTKIGTLKPNDRGNDGNPTRIRLCATAFSADGARVLTSNMDGVLRLWDVAAAGILGEIQSPGKSPIFGLAMTGDGKHAISGGMDFVGRLWDLESKKELHTFEGHTNSVRAVAYSPRNKQIATAGPDQSIRIWDEGDGRELYAFKSLKGSVDSLAYSSDGKSLIYGCRNGRIEMLDFNQALRIRKLQELIPAAQQTLKDNPNDIPSLMIVGEWLSLHGVWLEASNVFEKAAKLAASNFDANAMLGKCYWMLARNEDDAAKRAGLLVNSSGAYQAERDRLRYKNTADAETQRRERERLELIINAIKTEKTKSAK